MSTTQADCHFFCFQVGINFREHLLLLDSKLEQIHVECNDKLQCAEKSTHEALSQLNELHSLLIHHEFGTKVEEITFFKEVKAVMLSRFYFCADLFDLECSRPANQPEFDSDYLCNFLKRMESFKEENKEFCKYIRCGCTLLDDKYFVRGFHTLHLISSKGQYCHDCRSSTYYDHLLARYLANERLEKYIKKEIIRLNTKENISQKDFATELNWTETKSALIELIYALNETACINKGKTDIKVLANVFSNVFNINLGDFYRTYNEISNRTQRTKFLDTLRENLLQKMEKNDEN